MPAVPLSCLPLCLDAASLHELAQAQPRCAQALVMCDPGAVNGAGATLAALQHHKPDLIVAGFAADDDSGADLLRAVLVAAPGTPVIFYVRHCADEDAAAALRAGAADVILAPAPARLAAAIDRCLEHSATRRYLERAQKELVGAHHAEFLPLMMDALAHDLRNMLQPLTYATQILKRTTESTLRPLQESLEGATQRGLEIVASILSFGSDRSRGRGVVDVQDLIRTVRMLLPNSLARRVAVSCESPLRMVRCGPHQIELEQCILALARRALHHLPGGSRLAIRVERQAGEHGPLLRIGVEAEGPGATLPPLADSRELLLCRVLAARHGGSVQAAQPVAGRERIEILLPLLEGAASAGTLQRKVLIASHGETAAALIEAGTAAGFDLTTVADSAAASRYLLDPPLPDFAIIDADLPQLEGARVFSLLRKRGFAGRVVLLTSPGSEFGRNAGDDSVFYMTKPADGDSVFGALHDAQADAGIEHRPSGALA
ncbi:MAG TPA: hypothetical protein VGE51_06685 [Fontimonas sp.]